MKLVEIATDLASKAKETAAGSTAVKANANKTVSIQGHKISHDENGLPKLSQLKRLPAATLLRYIEGRTKVKKSDVINALTSLISTQESAGSVDASSTRKGKGLIAKSATAVSPEHGAILLIMAEAVGAASMTTGTNGNAIRDELLALIGEYLPADVLAAAKKATHTKYGSDYALHEVLGSDGDIDVSMLHDLYKQIKNPKLKALAKKAGLIIKKVDEENDGKGKGFQGFK